MKKHDTFAPAAKTGNFVIGNCFCDIRCCYGHKIRMFNIGRGHYAACDECRSFIFLGANLTSGWRSENRHIWAANINRVSKYRFYG